MGHYSAKQYQLPFSFLLRNIVLKLFHLTENISNIKAFRNTAEGINIHMYPVPIYSTLFQMGDTSDSSLHNMARAFRY
jgi:hypothetical protein